MDTQATSGLKGCRVVFPEKGTARLEQYSVPEPKDNQVMVRVSYTLISNGTEKACLLGSENTIQSFPQHPGYSSVGTVVKTGKNVKSVKQGDRVFVEYGGHSSYNVKASQYVYKIPDDVELTKAVFVKLASYPLFALRRSRLEMGESVVIVGLGMLGLFGIQLAKIGGGGLPLIAVGNREVRLEKARAFGADYVFPSDDPDLVQKILSITKQLTFYEGANVIIETSGSESALQTALKYAAKRCRIMINGCNRVTTQPIDIYKYVHRKGVSLFGVHESTRLENNSAPGNWTSKRDYLYLFHLMANDRLRTKEMISEINSPEAAPDVYRRLANDRDFPMGVIFDWTKIQ